MMTRAQIGVCAVAGLYVLFVVGLILAVLLTYAWPAQSAPAPHLCHRGPPAITWTSRAKAAACANWQDHNPPPPKVKIIRRGPHPDEVKT